jgi:hypothetical protein
MNRQKLSGRGECATSDGRSVVNACRLLVMAAAVTGAGGLVQSASAGPATFSIVVPPAPSWQGLELVALSDDGSVAIGNATIVGTRQGFRWTRSGGAVAAPGPVRMTAISGTGARLFGSRIGGPPWVGTGMYWDAGGLVSFIAPTPSVIWAPNAVNANGTVAVLSKMTIADGSTGGIVFGVVSGVIWTQAQPQPPQPLPQWTVNDISRNGATIVGQAGPTTMFGGDPRLYRPYVRNRAGTVVFNIHAPAGEDASGEAIAISGNGALVVGRLAVGNASRRAFAWSSALGTRYLPSVAGDGAQAAPLSVSIDGSHVVGYDYDAQSQQHAVLWTSVNVPASTASVDLAAALRAQGARLPAGHRLLDARAISGDGRTIVGTGVDATGQHEFAFVATLATACPADLDDGSGFGIPDDGVGIEDLFYFLTRFEAGDVAADLDNDGEPTAATPDGAVTVDDLLYFLARFEGGC